MRYNYRVSLANLHNVVTALNHGGVKTCYQIAELIWEEAPEWKREDKVARARDAGNRNPGYARNQLRQEVRRTLYNYFNNPNDSEFHIFRVNALNDSERFYVAEEQEQEHVVIPGFNADYDGNTDVSVGESLCSIVITPSSSLIERLNAANNTASSTSHLLRESQANSDGETFICRDMPDEMVNVLNEELGREFNGVENTPLNRRLVAQRVSEIIRELENNGR